MHNQRETLLAHEKLHAYRVALDFGELAHDLSRKLPRAKGQLGDQLQRASESILLCIAEGSGVAWHSADQKKFFRSARASAHECAAIIDVCRIRRVGSQEERALGRELVVRLVQMLTKLCR